MAGKRSRFVRSALSMLLAAAVGASAAGAAPGRTNPSPAQASPVGVADTGFLVDLAITFRGTGRGLVRLTSPTDSGDCCGFGPKDCASSCLQAILQATPIELVAEPASGSVFAGWGGACGGAGTSTCPLRLDADATVTVTFISASSPGDSPRPNGSEPKKKPRAYCKARQRSTKANPCRPAPKCRKSQRPTTQEPCRK